MKVIVLLLLIYLTACASNPVKKEVVSPPPKVTVKTAKPFLNHVKKTDKKAFEEVKDKQLILHIHNSEMTKASRQIDFWSALDPLEFNEQFASNLYHKDGNEYIHHVCGSAKQEQVLLLDFLSYDVITDDQEETYEMESLKEKYEPLMAKNVEAVINYCREFKEIICSKEVKKLKKKTLIKELKDPKLDAQTKTKKQNQWYEVNFCESVKRIK